MKKQRNKRLWAVLLSAALIVTQLPAEALAENGAAKNVGGGVIASFDPLEEDVAEQTVDVGTALSELNLPDTVTANVCQDTEDMIIPDEGEGEDGISSTASPSDADESVSGGSEGHPLRSGSKKTAITAATAKSKIPVGWDSDPAYDGGTEGSYVFTADVGGYALSGAARLPQITVTVTGGDPGRWDGCENHHRLGICGRREPE